MRKTYYPGDIVTALNVGEHYLVYNYMLKDDYQDKYSTYNQRQFKPSVQGQLYYVGHIDHEKGYVLLEFSPGIYFSFYPQQISLYRRPLRNHIIALVQWLRHTFYFSKPVQSTG